MGRRLYLCTDAREATGDLVGFVAACIAGGVDIVQLRDKDLEGAALLAAALAMRDVCRAHDVPFIVNDRPDLALVAQADGVHVGQGDLPPWACRRVLGQDAIIGRSTHAPEELDTATLEPVDYLSAGPVVATPTKPDRDGVGLGYITYATAHSAGRPVFVTGGANPDTVGPIVAAGGDRVVAVRWLTHSANPEQAAAALRSALDAAMAARTDSAGS